MIKKGFKISLLLITNIILFASLLLTFIKFKNEAAKQLKNQNLNDITNINISAANISSDFYTSSSTKLKDIKKYTQSKNLIYDDLINFLIETNSNKDLLFQLIDKNSSGIEIAYDGSLKKINYQSSSYEKLNEIFIVADSNKQEVEFTPEFTNPSNAVQSFAFFIYITLTEKEIPKTYTLMAISKTSTFTDKFTISIGFDNLATALIDRNGNYILSNQEFKSDNFFKYLYVYNGLTRDEMNEDIEFVKSKTKGYFIYKNYLGEDSVFIYSEITNTPWYCITTVPKKSFHQVNISWQFILTIILILLIIFVIDVLWLIQLNKQLSISSKIAIEASEAKTRFLSSMSHDIRTPINVITGMTELALYEKNTKVTTEYLQNIQSSGKFLLGLVNDILDLNKIESGKMELHPEPYTYQEFSHYINSIIYPLCKEKNIELELTTNNKDIVLIFDKLRINQVFFNLLSNAVKFTNQGGKISLDCKLTKNEKNIHVIFSVTDNGIGMSESFQKKMFEDFSQENKIETSNNVGTGLGLVIVKNNIELMKGNIKVESKEGKGSKFIINIDTDEYKGMKSTVETDVDISILSGKHILICEDNPLNTKVVVKILERQAVICHCAENGQIGLDLFKQSDEGFFDAILMDIRMPVMDGLEAMKLIRSMSNRKDSKTIPIIAFTANAYDIDLINSQKAGANYHMVKPINATLLYKLLSKYIKDNS